MLKYLSPLQRLRPELMLSGLVLVLALFYGMFAIAAVHSARGGSADFYVSDANPWQTVPAASTASDHRLAFRVPPTATP